MLVYISVNMRENSDILIFTKIIEIFQGYINGKILFKMYKNTEKTLGIWCLDTVEDKTGQRGLFFCSLPLDAIINGREQRDGEPIRSRLACQPKTNCLLALTAGFYLHNSNPKAKAICTFPTPTSGAVFTRQHMEEKGRERASGIEPNHNEWNPPSRWINRGHNHTLIRVNT